MVVLAPRPTFPRLALPAVSRDLVRFAAVGVVNTGVFLLLYLAFRTVLPVVVANVLATVLTTIAGTSANGRVTFRVTGPVGVRRHAKSLVVTVLGLAITTGAVDLVGSGSAAGEVLVLVVASAVAGSARFVLMRHWVFGR
ncbi:GtrA family protein [Actinosynnema sp. NPDC020468]|uniref:GtrA family protein n=1 Tax=Actinosynnema sp. NPDC020468 TaxID=3154488 RepID=UPI0033D84D77